MGKDPNSPVFEEFHIIEGKDLERYLNQLDRETGRSRGAEGETAASESAAVEDTENAPDVTPMEE